MNITTPLGQYDNFINTTDNNAISTPILKYNPQRGDKLLAPNPNENANTETGAKAIGVVDAAAANDNIDVIIRLQELRDPTITTVVLNPAQTKKVRFRRVPIAASNNLRSKLVPLYPADEDVRLKGFEIYRR